MSSRLTETEFTRRFRSSTLASEERSVSAPAIPAAAAAAAAAAATGGGMGNLDEDVDKLFDELARKTVGGTVARQGASSVGQRRNGVAGGKTEARRQPSQNLFVGHLHRDTEACDIRAAFEVFGTIKVRAEREDVICAALD